MTYKFGHVIVENNAEIPVTEEVMMLVAAIVCPVKLVKKPDEAVNEEPATKLEPVRLVKKSDEPVKA